MIDYSVLEHPYFYLTFISLHLILGQCGSSIVYKFRYGKSPLICYQVQQPNKHQNISRWLTIPVIIWFTQIFLLITSVSFRNLSINKAIIQLSPIGGLIGAGICLIGML